jgi:hypothetical protein
LELAVLLSTGLLQPADETYRLEHKRRRERFCNDRLAWPEWHLYDSGVWEFDFQHERRSDWVLDDRLIGFDQHRGQLDERGGDNCRSPIQL